MVVCASMLADLGKSGNQCFPDFPRGLRALGPQVGKKTGMLVAAAVVVAVAAGALVVTIVGVEPV